MLQQDLWSNAGQYTHLGITLALAVLGGFFGGYWIDRMLDTIPLFAIIGTFAGATAGFVNLVRKLTRMRTLMEKKSEFDSTNENG